MFVSTNLLTKMSPVRYRTNKLACSRLYEQGMFLLKTFVDTNNNIFSDVRFSISHFLSLSCMDRYAANFHSKYLTKLSKAFLVGQSWISVQQINDAAVLKSVLFQCILHHHIVFMGINFKIPALFKRPVQTIGTCPFDFTCGSDPMHHTIWFIIQPCTFIDLHIRRIFMLAIKNVATISSFSTHT